MSWLKPPLATGLGGGANAGKGGRGFGTPPAFGWAAARLGVRLGSAGRGTGPGAGQAWGGSGPGDGWGVGPGSGGGGCLGFHGDAFRATALCCGRWGPRWGRGLPKNGQRAQKRSGQRAVGGSVAGLEGEARWWQVFAQRSGGGVQRTGISTSWDNKSH